MDFTDWLKKQQHRVDAIGALAAYVATDEKWPRTTYREQMRYLVERRDDEHVPALQAALFEYRDGRDGAQQ
jgi:hypothetical protein